MSLEITVNVPNFLLYLLTGVTPIGEDQKDVIGDSRLAYLGENHPFVTAATWHDAVYKREKRAELVDSFTRFDLDLHFLNAMLSYCHGDEGLTKQAVMLFLFVRQYGEPWFEN